jgi:hypothetical protein
LQRADAVGYEFDEHGRHLDLESGKGLNEVEHHPKLSLQWTWNMHDDDLLHFEPNDFQTDDNFDEDLLAINIDAAVRG